MWLAVAKITGLRIEADTARAWSECRLRTSRPWSPRRSDSPERWWRTPMCGSRPSCGFRPNSELFFLHTTLLPDDLRIQLSRCPGCSGDRRDHRRLGGCLGGEGGKLLDTLHDVLVNGIRGPGTIDGEEPLPARVVLEQGHSIFQVHLQPVLDNSFGVLCASTAGQRAGVSVPRAGRRGGSRPAPAPRAAGPRLPDASGSPPGRPRLLPDLRHGA